MALVKVLALDATGVIETEIDTGSGGGGSGGSIIKHTIDLTNGQTAVTVPGGYTSAGIAVYLNGAYLSPAEYTATTSPDITLAVGAPSDDSVLDVVVFEASGGSGGASALDDLTDVVITSVAINEVLKWDGTNWVNGTASGGGDDGVTLANICDLAMDGRTLISDIKPYYSKMDVGIAQLLTGGTVNVYGAPLYGNDIYTSSVAGTGAQVSVGAGNIQCISGTTATGYSTYRHGVGFSFSSPAYSPYATPGATLAVDQKMAASAVVYVSAVSDATDNYTASVTLMGQGPNTNAAPGINDKGFTLTYNHAVNSGNWVITYRGDDNLLKTVNTSVPPATSLATAMRMVAKAHRTTVTAADVTIDLGGTVYTITDSRFNTTTVYAEAVVAARIIKSAGTASRTLFVRHASVARNLAV